MASFSINSNGDSSSCVVPSDRLKNSIKQTPQEGVGDNGAYPRLQSRLHAEGHANTANLDEQLQTNEKRQVSGVKSYIDTLKRNKKEGETSEALQVAAVVGGLVILAVVYIAVVMSGTPPN